MKGTVLLGVWARGYCSENTCQGAIVLESCLLGYVQIPDALKADTVALNPRRVTEPSLENRTQREGRYEVISAGIVVQPNCPIC